MTFVPASLKNSTKLDIDNEFENMKKEMIEKLQSSTKELVDDQVVVKKDSAKIDVRKELQNREVDAKKPPEDQPEDGNFVINESKKNLDNISFAFSILFPQWDMISTIK